MAWAVGFTCCFVPCTLPGARLSHVCCIQRKEDWMVIIMLWIGLTVVWHGMLNPQHGSDPTRGIAGLLGIVAGTLYLRANASPLRMVLVPADSPHALVFEHAERLIAGETVPLTLASHPLSAAGPDLDQSRFPTPGKGMHKH